MNIKEALLKEHSKKQSLLIADYIGKNQHRFDELIQLFLNDEYRVVQRAAWALSFAGEKNPQLLLKHIPKLINHLETPELHDAVKRNTLRVLQFVKIPDEYLGKLADMCFKFLCNSLEPIAVRAYSLNTLIETCKKYPELKHELGLVIDELKNENSPAIKSSMRKALKELGK